MAKKTIGDAIAEGVSNANKDYYDDNPMLRGMTLFEQREWLRKNPGYEKRKRAKGDIALTTDIELPNESGQTDERLGKKRVSARKSQRGTNRRSARR